MPHSEPVVPDPAERMTTGEHRRFVRARLARLGVPPEGLDDAVQEVFLVVLRRLDDFDTARPVRPWLAGITRKVAGRDHLRRRRHVEREGSPVDETRMGARDARPEAALLLEQYMQHLDGTSLEIFLLSEVRGMTAKEIGAHLGLNANTVSTRLRRAQRELDRVVARHELAERRWHPVPWSLALWRWPGSNAGRVGNGAAGLGLIVATVGLVGYAAGVAICDDSGAQSGRDTLAPRADGVSERRTNQDRPPHPPTTATRRDVDAVHPGMTRLQARPENEFEWLGTSGFTRNGTAEIEEEAAFRLGEASVTLRYRLTNSGTTRAEDVEAWLSSRMLADYLRQHDALTQTVDLDPGTSRYIDFEVPLPEGEVFDLMMHVGRREGAASGTGLCFCREAAGLAECHRDDCVGAAPRVEDVATGELVTVSVQSTCEQPLTLVITPPEAELSDPSYEQIQLAPGATTVLSLDTGLAIRKLNPSTGHLSLSATPNAPGDRMSFSCTGVFVGPEDKPAPDL